jgi:hypothetical protein
LTLLLVRTKRVLHSHHGRTDDPGFADHFKHVAFKETTSLGSKDIQRELQLMAVDGLPELIKVGRHEGA